MRACQAVARSVRPYCELRLRRIMKWTAAVGTHVILHKHVYIYVHIDIYSNYVHTYNVYTCMYIYIQISRGRTRDVDINTEYMSVCLSACKCNFACNGRSYVCTHACTCRGHRFDKGLVERI